MKAPKLLVESLDAGYGPVRVVHDMNLVLAAGSITAIFGPNGAGKSTTCRTLAGFLPAKAGSISLDGRDVTSKPCWWRARQGVYLVPEGRGVFPGLTVDDNLRVLLASSSDRAKVYDRFPVLGERRRQHAGSLSGGEQQMLSLAPVLVRRAEVLIVDEPTLGLAPRVAEQILGIFSELRSSGATILLVGESPHGIIDIADEVALLHVGRITWSGSASALDQAILEQAYFGETDDT